MTILKTIRLSTRSIFCLLTILLVNIAACQRAQAEPFIPSDDAQVLEELPRVLGPEAREIRRLRSALAENPRDLRTALALARRYREIGRAESDPRYLGYAQAALAPWWQAEHPPRAVLVLRALLRQAWHDFDGAKEDLKRVLARDPAHTQARLALATVLAATGEAAAAAANCRALRRHGLVATACRSHSESLMGRASEAYDRLAAALAEGVAEPVAIRLWALTILAEIARRLGRDQDAERHFRDALSLDQRSTHLLAAYADHLLDRGRPAKVRDLLQGELRPDGLLLRLAIAEDRLGGPDATSHTRALEARFAAARARGDSIHLREQARFSLHLLNDPAPALDLALENWQLQREPWDARIVLEAAIAAGKPRQARAVLDWLGQRALEDRQVEALIKRLKEMGA